MPREQTAGPLASALTLSWDDDYFKPERGASDRRENVRGGSHAESVHRGVREESSGKERSSTAGPTSKVIVLMPVVSTIKSVVSFKRYF